MVVNPDATAGLGERGPYRRVRRQRCAFPRAGRAGCSSGRVINSRWSKEPSSGSASRGSAHPSRLKSRSPPSLRPCCCCPGSRLPGAPADPAGAPTETDRGRDSKTALPLFHRPPKRSPRVAVKSSGSRRVSRGHHGRRAPATGEVSRGLNKSWIRSGGGPLVGRRGTEDKRAEAAGCYHGRGARAPPRHTHTRANTHTALLSLWGLTTIMRYYSLQLLSLIFLINP